MRHILSGMLSHGPGVTGEEEAADYYIQDFAFHVPGRVDKPRLLEDGPTDSPTFVPVEPVRAARVES